ncbi:FtsX-like permease family protein [Phenylobacterium sp.]|jgi:putative ABC transport system permease protein|uniref:FtsX-like permease family protein n=1 Tax=Phenylobacterium sp. TaxID=1871053 RepID=UPI002E2F60E4|nr:FtsX-like permease family protein [Phenylobacterium sp.]HEX3364238.1 FtsX-like permease family protein [Phenylobacterium sp.]
MFGNYLAASIRNLQRNGVYAALTVTGLAIGFASAILIGLYLRHELTYDQFIPGHERVFLVNQLITAPDKPQVDMDVSSAHLADDLKLEFPQIEYTARTAAGFPPTVRRGDVSVSELQFVWADPDFFKILPVPVVAGDAAHGLEAGDDVVLTRAAARRYFGRDAPIGGQLLVDGHAMRVTAVIEDLPSNTHLAGEVFGSSKATFSMLAMLDKAGYTSNSNQTYVRLKSGASAAAIDAQLHSFLDRRVVPQIRKIDPDWHGVRYAMRLKPLTSIHLQPSDGGGDPKPGADVKVLAGIGVIGVLIVVVAAINFVTLMTARASRRATEVGVRKALGAQRKDLIVQFMGEALIYVAVALVLAVALAELLLPAVNAALQRKMSFSYLTDPSLLLVMLGVTVATGLLAGFYPALVLSSFRPSSVLKGGPVAASGGGGVREILVVAQFAVLIALLLAAVTIYRQTNFGLKDATHTNKDGVMMLFASPCTETLRNEVLAVPGVRGAACGSPAAVGLSMSSDMTFRGPRKTMLMYAPVDFGFFQIYGIPPIAGRLPNPDRPGDDGARLKDTAPTILLNEAAVRALGFPSPQAAIGQQVIWHFNPTSSFTDMAQPTPPPRASEVIGVVPDFTFRSVRQKIDATFYYVGPRNDALNSVALSIKIDPVHRAETVKAIDRLWTKISAGMPLQQYFADQFLLRLYIDNVIQGGFIAVCALIAVSIACLGLFALSAYTAERRTREIGIRKAMGASSSEILRLLLWQFAKPVLWANLLALPLAWLAMDYWLKGFAYHVDLAPWTFVAAAGTGIVIAWATVFFHALRVARARPVGALRYE